jgi:hypothetical protein
MRFGSAILLLLVLARTVVGVVAVLLPPSLNICLPIVFGVSAALWAFLLWLFLQKRLASIATIKRDMSFVGWVSHSFTAAFLVLTVGIVWYELGPNLRLAAAMSAHNEGLLSCLIRGLWTLMHSGPLLFTLATCYFILSTLLMVIWHYDARHQVNSQKGGYLDVIFLSMLLLNGPMDDWLILLLTCLSWYLHLRILQRGEKLLTLSLFQLAFRFLSLVPTAVQLGLVFSAIANIAAPPS